MEVKTNLQQIHCGSVWVHDGSGLQMVLGCYMHNTMCTSRNVLPLYDGLVDNDSGGLFANDILEGLLCA